MAERGGLGDGGAIEHDVLRVAAVELHQGDAGIGSFGLLLFQEGVEAADDIVGDAGHGTGAVQQEVDVGGGLGVHGLVVRGPGCERPPLERARRAKHACALCRDTGAHARMYTRG